MADAAGRTVAVTGATGFIGGVMVRRLVSSGWKVRALLRRSAKSTVLMPGIETVSGDLADAAGLQQLLHGTYAVIHCAGAVRGITQAQFDKVNVDGVQRLVAAALAQSAPPRLLLVSSLAAREPDLSPYATSKRRGEGVLAVAANGLQWTVLRPPAVYGPGDKELLPLFRLMARGIAPRVGARTARFSLLYVDDLARAALHWLQSDRCWSQTFTLHDGCEGGYAWREVADAMATLTGRRVLQFPVPPSLLRFPALLNWLAAGIVGYAPMFTPGKVRELAHPQWVCDNQGISAALGWTPTVSLVEGLRHTLAQEVD